jgi:phage terminase large subunit-like protein
LAAVLLLCHLCGPVAIPNSQLYSTAQSRDQAALIHSLAAKIVRMSPVLNDAVIIKDGSKELLCPEMGTKYRALSAEATTAFGLSPVFIVHDELGQVRGPRSALYEALETATGAQQDPLSIIISTQARTNADLLSILIDDALAGHDPRTTISLYTAPMDLDPFDPETIAMANPALGVFLNPREVKAMASDARRMPARENEFRNLVLNQRIEASSPFIKLADWQACAGQPIDLQGREVYAGLDLSEAADLTALVVIGRVDGIWHCKPTFWLPGHGLADRARADRVPYDVWADKGFLLTTPGRTISYDYVAQFLKRNLFERHKVSRIGFDRWNYRHLKPWLLNAGFSEKQLEDQWVEFGQGTQSMSPALRDLEQIILARELRHGDHPVLKMCAMNAVIETRVKEGEQTKDSSNRKLSKKRSNGRIDGMVALTMAVGVAPVGKKEIDIAALIG